MGEIWVRGESVADGYWERPEVSRETFQAHLTDGRGPFLRTGDLGFLHPNATGSEELFVTGRIKDLIILRGRNLYPQDLETTAEAAHAALRPGCGAAFAVEVEGEERLVLVQEISRHAKVEHEELRQTIREAVAAAHEVQAHDIVFLREGTVPKTSSGKIRRRACHAAYLDGSFTPARSVPASRTSSGNAS